MRKPVIRCSEAGRQLLCPGARTLIPLVAPRTSDEGADGSAIHAAIARKLVYEVGARSESDLMAEAELPLNSEWIVGFCVREVKDNLPEDWSLEVEAALAYDFGAFELSGHIDAVAISPDVTEAIGWDYKSGYNPTDPADANEQVLSYIILLRRAYPTLRKVTFYIVQPRNDEESGFERVSKVTVEWAEGVDFITANFVKRMEKSLTDSMTVDSGPAQCRFCPAAGPQCPAIQLEKDTMKAKLTPEILAKITAEPDDALLGDFVVAAKTLETPFDNARDLIKTRIAQNGFVKAGCGISISAKKSKGFYDVTNPKGFHKALLTLIPAERIPHCTKPSMTQIKLEIADAMNVPKSGKAAITSETLFDAKLRPYTEQGEKVSLIFS